MVFHDILPSLKYLTDPEFINWLQRLTGYRDLIGYQGKSPPASLKKKVSVLVCVDEEPSEDYELAHLRLGKHLKRITPQLGTTIILNEALAHSVTGPEKTHTQSYYQIRQHHDLRLAENRGVRNEGIR
jgi:hypothetical protein